MSAHQVWRAVSPRGLRQASVEYTVQTFIGLAEFRPTNTFILDVATKQILVKLEKTSYFAVRPPLL